jgi:hypothetical protein
MNVEEIIERWGYCSLCLCVMNASSWVTVSFYEGENRRQETCPDPLNPRQLIKWIQKYEFEKYADFTIDNYNGAFKPVGIIQGTPVCTTHLRTIVGSLAAGRGLH